ncbi:MAG: hypothetical protein OEL19_02895 [Sulfurimonas sp.]|nr:hypothetical protein [Sulfurimonas sp.]
MRFVFLEIPNQVHDDKRRDDKVRNDKAYDNKKNLKELRDLLFSS